jgi:hypothetical protein
VDCKIYNSSTLGKSIQNQSTTPFGRCGLTLYLFTTREFVIDFAIHQLLGPLISTILHSRSFIDRLILHSKSVVDGSILHCKANDCIFIKDMMVKLLIYHTGMCIKGPESWWIAKSITPQLVVNQSKINPQLPLVVVD